jgi:hypothetical protein
LCLTVSFPCNSSNIIKGREFWVHLHHGEQPRVVVGGNAGGPLINDGLAIVAPSPEGGGGGGSRGGGATGTAGPGLFEFGLARLGAAGPERAQRSRTQAEATRNERHRESDERQQRRGRKTKMAKLWRRQVQATRLRRGKRKRTTAVEIAVQAAAVMTAAMAMQAVQDGTRRLAEVGRRGV